MTVLIVEDTEDSRIMLRDVLQSSGYKVRTASNGAEALDLMTDTPEIIISDILMPVMDGYELCRSVKSREAYRSVPFMFYTATYTEERDRQLALSVGADYFLVKPQTHETLIDIIRRVLAGESMQPERNISGDSFDQQHNRVISHKLDKKVRELEIERELLHRKEQQLRVITDALPILISHIDNDYKYRYVNKGYEQWHNKSRREIIGHSVREINGEDAWKVIGNYLEQAFAGKCVDYESVMIFSDGEKRYVEVRYVPNFTEEGQVDGVVVLVKDISANKKLKSEQDALRLQLLQAQKMDAIGHLAGGIAHDFNNILASMLGYTELAFENISSSETKTRKYLEHVLASGARARDLVAQMLTFSKGDTSEPQQVDLNVVLHDLVSFVEKMLPSSITINLHSDGDSHYIYSNIIQLQQIILNLCINARDAMNGAGSIQIKLSEDNFHGITCSSCNYPLEGHYITLSVVDTGTGIAAENISRIFEPFYTTKNIGEGSGMGLSVVHGIMHECHGHIMLESEPGMKTSFILLFPETGNIPGQEPAGYGLGDETVKNKINIMIVDDETGVSNFLQELLEFHGYGVKTFNASEGALTYFSEHPMEFSVVITDYTMPGMDGLRFAEQLKAINAQIKIFLCSGMTPRLDLSRYDEQLISVFLSKPFTAVELLNNLKNVIADLQ